GGDDHPQLRDPGQQGPGSHRGPPALRDRLRPHRGRRPPAIAHPLDGRVHRRLDDRADLPPDMRLPISYALGTEADGWTARLGSAALPNNWGQPMHWSFDPVDHLAFPALGLAIDAGRRGGSFPAVLNAANEVLV